MSKTKKPIYLDCAATTPIEPEVEAVMLHYMREEFGNAGSRTHEYGTRAKQAVERARDQIGGVVACQRDEVVFTSGATESNNLAILGLRKFAHETGRKHIVTSNIEHKAVLEPVEHLRKEYDFEVDYAPVGKDGIVHVREIEKLLRSDTLLVSLMHVNNETGIIQPIDAVAELLKDHPAYFHTDASQSFGKLIEPLQNNRIDLISISGHKIYGPKGIGALITRRRKYRKPPLFALMFGGGQEFGLRPGTIPVFLAAGLGEAAQISLRDQTIRRKKLDEISLALCSILEKSNLVRFLPEIAKVGTIIPLFGETVDSEYLLLKYKDIFSASNGAACSSREYLSSHVIDAINPAVTNGFVRISFWHETMPIF